MSKSSKNRLLVIPTFLILFFVLSSFFIKNVSANETNNASVSVTTTDATSLDNTISAPVTVTRKAPVSIATYSDTITESSDTYNYTLKTTNSNINTTDVVLPTSTEVPAQNYQTSIDNSIPTVTPTQNTNTVTPNQNTTVTSNNTKITNYVFIGDSRTVAMESVIGKKSDHTWSCKVAMGLKWLKSTGIPAVEDKITSQTAVIILMGVNDLYNVNNYISYINEKSIEWSNKGAKTYFVSVNPINESTYSGFKNTKIEEFNSKMYSGLNNVTYIDTYNQLMTHSISYTADGLHYKQETSQDIYDIIMNCIK